MIKGCRHRLIIDQTPQEPDRNLAVVLPTDMIVCIDRVQTYEGDPTSTRPRVPLANWTSVSLWNNLNWPAIDKMTQGQLQWNKFSDNNTDNRQGHRCDDYDNKPSYEIKSADGGPICSDEDGSTSGPGLEEVDWIQQSHEV